MLKRRTRRARPRDPLQAPYIQPAINRPLTGPPGPFFLPRSAAIRIFYAKTHISEFPRGVLRTFFVVPL